MEATDVIVPPAAAAESRPAIDVTDVVFAVRRRLLLVAVVVIAVVAIRGWQAFHAPRIFHTTTTVRIQSGNAAVFAGEMGGQGYDYRVDPLISEQRVIASRIISERTVDSLGLRVRPPADGTLPWSVLARAGHPIVAPDAGGGERVLRAGTNSYSLRTPGRPADEKPYGRPVTADGVTVVLDGPPMRDPRTAQEYHLQVDARSSAAGEVVGGLATKAIPQTDIVEISYDAPDALLVEQVANTVARTYAQYSREVSRNAARTKTAFILSQVDSQAIRLRDAQDSLKMFQERYQVGDVGKEQDALFATTAGLDDSRRKLELEQQVYIRLMGKLARADTADEDLRRLAGSEAVAGNRYISGLYDRWFDLLKQREQNITVENKNENNRDVQAVTALIAKTKSDIQSASEFYLQNLRTKIGETEAKSAAMRQQMERFPPLTAEQARLTSNVRTTQATFEELQRQYQIQRIAETDEPNKVRILDEAPRPDVPVGPRRMRTLLYAVAMGIALGVAIAFLLDRLEDTIRSPDELTTRMNVTTLGLIPAIDTRDSSRDAAPNVGRLITHADPRSPVAEAYRSLRTNLAFARSAAPLRTIVVASPGPGDGKSTTAANLAITFAQLGQRTVIVDADLRRAVLDRTFGVERTPGLTDCILGTVALADAAKSTPVANLFVVPSGQFPPNPSELLGSNAMRELIERMKAEFDVIVFDTPPLVAVTDAAVLSTLTDGTVLVTRANVTKRATIRRALSQLGAVHARVLGAVLNDVDSRSASYYGGHGYYYAYYGPESDRDRTLGVRLRKLVGR